MQPSKIELYLEVNARSDWQQQDLISEYNHKDLHNEHINTTYTRHIVASYCFQSLIGLANLLSAISCYKFHILKD